MSIIPLPRIIAAALFVSLAVGCSADAPFVPEPVNPPTGDRAPLTMKAKIDGFVYRAADGEGFMAGPIDVNKGGIRIYATFDNTAGNLTAPLSSSDFEMHVSGTADGGPLPERVEYTRYDAFSGALYWIAPGQSVPVWLGLYQKSTGEYVFGPHAVTIARRAH